MRIYKNTPSQLITSATSNSITVGWNAVEAAEKYKIYRRYGKNNPDLLAEVSGLEYKDSLVIPGKVYYYQVASVVKGIASGLSQFIKAEIQAVVPNGINKTE